MESRRILGTYTEGARGERENLVKVTKISILERTLQRWQRRKTKFIILTKLTRGEAVDDFTFRTNDEEESSQRRETRNKRSCKNKRGN